MLTSLREAIAMANENAAADTITFDSTVFATSLSATASTISLALGPLHITDDLTVIGPGQHLLSMDGGGVSRVIEFSAASGDLTLQGLTVTGGRTDGVDSGGSQSGAGIRFVSNGALRLDGSTVIANRTVGSLARGAGIFAADGDIVLNQSTITGNVTSGAGASGGGIFIGSGTVVAIDSELSGNRTEQSGGKGAAIYSSGTQVTLIRNTVSGNRTLGRSADGGAIFSTGGVTVDGSVVTGNMTVGDESDGGAIFATNTLAILQSDISGNSTMGADSGGGGLVADSATVVIENSSLTNNETRGRSSYGAGLFAVRSSVTITGSTLSGNTAGGAESRGGGVGSLLSSVSLTSSTVTRNAAAAIGGGFFFSDNDDKPFTVANSIVADNQDSGFGPDIAIAVNPSALTVASSLIGENSGTNLSESQTPNFDGNLIGDASGGGRIDPMLGPLARVGITRLHPLQENSPAIDSADNSRLAAVTSDQRGTPFTRINNIIADMGSMERQTILPTALVVTTPQDELNFDNDQVSLREAVQVANGDIGKNVIQFDPTVLASNETIKLQLGELTITDTLSIQPSAETPVTIDGQSRSRVIEVADGLIDLELSGVKITGGLTTRVHSSGGGIRFHSAGTLTLRQSEIVSNHVRGDGSSGGGIDAPNGLIEMHRSEVVGNSTTGLEGRGGGIRGGKAVTLLDSTVANNATRGRQASGGGIFTGNANDAALSLMRSTVAGNSASGNESDGGGIAVAMGQVTIVGSTVSNNTASGNGGGVFAALSSEAHSFTANTLVQNQAGGAGGGLYAQTPANGSVMFAGSIVATNSDSGVAADLDVSGVATATFVSNLIGDNVGTDLQEAQDPDSSGNLVGSSGTVGGRIDPLLADLALRGGPTPTHALRSGSPAIDAGDSNLLTNVATDQRGAPFTRRFGDAPDIGSYESQTLDDSFFLVTTLDDVRDPDDARVSLREAIENASGSEGVETIRFSGDLFSTPQTLTLRQGELDIPESLQIFGPGQNRLTIDAAGNSRVWNISAGRADVVLADMTITGGRTTDHNDAPVLPNAIDSTHSGAGIRFDAEGSLTLNRVTLRDNQTEGDHAGGGGLFVGRAALTLNQSSFSGNRTVGQSSGGGGLAAFNADVRIVESVLVDNQTTGGLSGGGGLHVSGTLQVIDSTLSANSTQGSEAKGGGAEVTSADGTFQFIRSTIDGNATSGFGAVGGGIAVSGGMLEMVNSTVSSNQADSLGGGIAIINRGDGPEQHLLVSTTVTENVAQNIGGIYFLLGDNDAALLHNSLIAKNQATDGPSTDVGLANLRGSLIARSSLIGDNHGAPLPEAPTPDERGNLIGSATGNGIIDPQLGPLANNGGLNRTHEPFANSPVIDGGDDALAVDSNDQPLTVDGRGEPFERRFGTTDIGSFEVQPPREPVIDWPTPTSIFVGTPLSSTQLNATTNTPGTFRYQPDSGAVLPLGQSQLLSLDFTPDDDTHFVATTATVMIDVVNRADLGDAPDTYATLRSSDGPRHAESDLRLGAAIDVEIDGQPSSDGSGDGDDEDGVTFVSEWIANATQTTTAAVVVDASSRGSLDAWIDFDGNGSFEHPSEHIGGGTSLRLFTGSNTIPIPIPAGAAPGATFARFRFSSNGGLLPTGAAEDGEVEDYLVTILDGSTPQIVHLQLPRGAVVLRADADQRFVERLGTEIFRVTNTSVQRYHISGGDFSTVLTIDNRGSNAIPSGGLFFDGGGPVNTLRVTGPLDSLDLVAGNVISLANVGVIDISDSPMTNVRIDSQSARRADPRGGGIVLVGSAGDSIEFADASQWRMDAPVIVAGFVFRRITLGDTFVQTDFLSPWQNLAQPSDINNDGQVSAGDALRIVNELSRNEFSDPDTSLLSDPVNVDPWPDTYFDQNGDGRATALDALRVINEISRQTSPSGEPIAARIAAPPSSKSSSDRAGDRLGHVAGTPSKDERDSQASMPGTESTHLLALRAWVGFEAGIGIREDDSEKETPLIHQHLSGKSIDAAIIDAAIIDAAIEELGSG